MWLLTVIANFLLILAIIRRRTWRLVPLFSAVQFIGIIFIAVQIFMYFDPKIPDSTYHAFWFYTDTLSILLDALCFKELLDRCPGDKWLCASAYFLLLHVVIKFHEAILREALRPYHNWYRYRIALNVFVTLLQAFSIYSSREVPNARSKAPSKTNS